MTIADVVMNNPGSPGRVGAMLHHPVLYDLFVRIALHGRERAFREKLLDLARLSAGETVLDVGCGTGTLAALATRRAGPEGRVYGVDASPEMIQRARAKARRVGSEAQFLCTAAQTLPFPGVMFDVVLSTLMLHHLGRVPRRQVADEMRRVIKPTGRVLVVEFAQSTRRSRGFHARFQPRHGRVAAQDVEQLLRDAGFDIAESGAVDVRERKFFENMHFVLASPRQGPGEHGVAAR